MANLRAKDFAFGDTKVLAFKAPGTTAASSIGDPQVKFATTEGDWLYLDTEYANDVERMMQARGVAYGEDFMLTRHKTSRGGSRWEVVPARAGRDAGGHNVPQRSDAYEEPVQRSAAPVAAVAAQPITPASAKLCSAFMASIDAVFEAQAYADRRGLKITFSSEDVRATAISAYITACKDGGAR